MKKKAAVKKSAPRKKPAPAASKKAPTKKKSASPRKATAPRKTPARKSAAKKTRTMRAALLPYQDPSLSAEKRAADLVSRMTLEERMKQLLNDAPAIPRLGVGRYVWQCEGLHGVARAGVATVFPQCIGLAATWDVPLHLKVAAAISDEARAKHHDSLRKGEIAIYTGLTYWSPNINIFRDPRWGRGQETYGEDPYLTSRFGVAFVRGMQGDDPKHLKTVATPKHYAVHSGPEAERHGFNAVVDERDLRETYLPAFKATVKEGRAVSVMGAYNRTNGEACCASPRLLQEILRDEWKFDGYVVSDCVALDDIWRSHGLAKTRAEAAALALRNGCDLECGDTFSTMAEALKLGLVAEEDIDLAVRRTMTARIRLGMFDPPEQVRWAKIPISVNDSAPHRALCRRASRESMVLLRNRGGALPLRKDLRKILVVGPNADDIDVLVGNYNGTPSHPRTVLQGITAAVSRTTEVVFRMGSGLLNMDLSPREPILARTGWRSPAQGEIAQEGPLPAEVKDLTAFNAVVDEARTADAIIAVVGISPELEGEQGEGLERSSLDIPAVQEHLLRALRSAGRPLVVVLMGGSAMSVNWAAENADGLLLAWYPGGEGGDAVADVLFGDYNPAGRLPVTFYKSVDQLPEFRDYRMAGRTYRYFKGQPLYPFGYGLSYTRFSYSAFTAPPGPVTAGQPAQVSFEVRNAGTRPGDEVAQVYLTNERADVPVPLRQLVGFERITLKPGESRRLSFSISAEQMSIIDNAGRRRVLPGTYLVAAGGSLPGFEGESTSGPILSARFDTSGAPVELDP
jgi:beta-glucosidase